MVCRKCIHYEMDTEKRDSDSMCRVAFCLVSFNSMKAINRTSEYDGFVFAGDPKCDSFSASKTIYHFRRNGPPVAKGWPEGYGKNEAIKAKSLLMDRSMTASYWSKKLGIPGSSISMIRCGKMWPAVPYKK